MNKTFFLLIVLTFPIFCFAQKYKSIKSYVRFYSEAPVENIEAVNTKSTSIFDAGSKRIAFSVPIRDFYFAKALMQEHFNENYMESEKYPTATFSGQIVGLDPNSSATQQVKAEGKLSIHGVEKDVVIEGELKPGENYIKVKSKFMVKLEDYNIKVPSIVTYNISEIIEVTVLFDYAKL